MDRFSSRAGSAKPCAFCDIIAGRSAAHVVAEDALTLAFLDRSPLLNGHVLLVPKAHVAVLPQADDQTLMALARQLRTLSAAVPAAMQAQGSFVAQNNVVSQSVAHLHFHVVPRWKGDKLFSNNLTWKRVKYGEGEAEAVAERIRQAVASVPSQA